MSELEIVLTGREFSRRPAIATRHRFVKCEVPQRIWELLGILETCEEIKDRLEEQRSIAAKIEVECQNRLDADPDRPSKEELELPFALGNMDWDQIRRFIEDPDFTFPDPVGDGRMAETFALNVRLREEFLDVLSQVSHPYEIDSRAWQDDVVDRIGLAYKHHRQARSDLMARHQREEWARIREVVRLAEHINRVGEKRAELREFDRSVTNYKRDALPDERPDDRVRDHLLIEHGIPALGVLWLSHKDELDLLIREIRMKQRHDPLLALSEPTNTHAVIDATPEAAVVAPLPNLYPHATVEGSSCDTQTEKPTLALPPPTARGASDFVPGRRSILFLQGVSALKASEDSPASAQDITVRCEGGKKRDAYKSVGAKLVKEGYIVSTRGRNGGYWLTDLGKKFLETKIKKDP